MDTRSFTRESKILTTDLRAGRNTDTNIKKYIEMISSAFTDYSTMKVALNLHTRREEQEEREGDEALMTIIREAAETGLPDTDEKKARFKELAAELTEIRDQITKEMRAITAYVDKLTMHESVLNRKIAAAAEDMEAPDINKIVQETQKFIFAENNDKVGTNLRIQQVVAQLPVRMTKQRFYDIIAQSVTLYKGGEISVAEDFANSIRDVAGITEIDDACIRHYTELYEVLTKTVAVLEAIDYPTISEEDVEKAGEEIEKSAEMLSELSSDLMQKQEIINDELILLLTAPYATAEYQDERYPAALELLRSVVAKEELTPEKLVDKLGNLEGMQEEAYERLVLLEADLDSFAVMMDKETGRELRMADLLTSSSLFTDLEQMLSINEEGRVMSDDASIVKLYEALIGDFEKLFSGMDKMKRRGVMGVVLGHVPVFFNSSDEIRDYIRYSLEHCGDQQELGAVWELLQTVIG